MHCYQSQNLLNEQLLLEVSLFRFNFLSELQYRGYYNEYPVTQTAFLYLELPLKRAFFV